MNARVRDTLATIALVTVVPATADAHHPSGGAGDGFPWSLLALAVLLLAFAVGRLMPALLGRRRKTDHDRPDPESDNRKSGTASE